jgi:hypothetical protein
MANEGVCIETPTEFARYTVDDGTGITLHTLMKLSGDNTVAASAANSDVWGGIAWEEKTASDGITELTCAMNGVWDLTCGAAGVTLGHLVSFSGANVIKDATEAEEITGDIIGKALEAGSASEVIRVRVGRTT